MEDPSMMPDVKANSVPGGAQSTQSTMATTLDRPPDWPFSHRPVQPQNAQNWHENTLTRLNLAKALCRDAQFQ